MANSMRSPIVVTACMVDLLAYSQVYPGKSTQCTNNFYALFRPQIYQISKQFFKKYTYYIMFSLTPVPNTGPSSGDGWVDTNNVNLNCSFIFRENSLKGKTLS